MCTKTFKGEAGLYCSEYPIRRAIGVQIESSNRTQETYHCVFLAVAIAVVLAIYVFILHTIK